MLYPALRKLAGAALAVVVVTFLFALVHYWQYKNSPGTIAAIMLLSFSLTVVRAWTGRVLPCFVIHLVFNGVQVVGLLFGHFRPESEPQQKAAARALYQLFTHAPSLFL
jgi:membrane protease YdiL (CAAX protease family)